MLSSYNTKSTAGQDDNWEFGWTKEKLLEQVIN
jgi:hypothetical protein